MRTLLVALGVGVAVLTARAGAVKTCADEPAELIIATKPVRPFSFVEGEEWIGFSWDFFGDLVFPAAQRYGLNETSFCVLPLENNEQVIRAVSVGNATFGHAALTKTASRELLVDFSNTWYVTGFRVLTHAEDDVLATIQQTAETVGAVVGLFLANVALMMLAGALILPVLEQLEPGPYPPWDDASKTKEWMGAALFTMGAMFGATQRGPTGRYSRPVAGACGGLGAILMAIFTAIMTFAVATTSSADAVKGVGDLVGRTVLVPRASTASQWAARNGNGIHFILTDTIDDAFEQLRDNRDYSVIYDAPPLEAFVARETEAGNAGAYRVVGPLFEEQQYGIAAGNRDDRLEAINKAILDTWETDEFAEMADRWFGVEEEVDVIANSNSQLYVLLLVGVAIVIVSIVAFIAYEIYKWLNPAAIPPPMNRKSTLARTADEIETEVDRLRLVIRSLSDSELVFAMANMTADVATVLSIMAKTSSGFEAAAARHRASVAAREKSLQGSGLRAAARLGRADSPGGAGAGAGAAYTAEAPTHGTRSPEVV